MRGARLGDEGGFGQGAEMVDKIRDKTGGEGFKKGILKIRLPLNCNCFLL
jgi:hypothetical protein